MAPAAGDDLVFPAGAANLVNTNDLTSLTFNSITITASDYRLRASSGGWLQLTGGISAQHTNGVCYVQQNVRLRAPQTWGCVYGGAIFVFDAAYGVDLGGYTLTIEGNGKICLNAQITNAGGLIKNGIGTLSFLDGGANTYSGLTRVNAGLVELGKPGWPPVAIPGSLVIETGATVLLLYHGQFGAGYTWILPWYTGAVITVRGILDLNQVYHTYVPELVLEGGQVKLGGQGVLTLLSNVTASGGAEISGSPGLVDLGGRDRLFTVADTLAGDDFVLSASVGRTNAINKYGTGQMLLSGSNWYSGATIVAQGLLAVSHANALGGPAAGTTVHTNATLEMRGDPFSSFSLRKPLRLNGSGAGGVGALRARNVLTLATAVFSCEEPIELTTDSVIRTEDKTSLSLKGALTGNGGFTKTGPGALFLQSTSANSYRGDTAVDQGLLRLACTAVYGAIPGGTLTIGDGAGGRRADVVRLDRSNQIAPTTHVRVRSSGWLDLNGYAQTLHGLLELVDGELHTGAGKLYLAGDSFVRAAAQGYPCASIYGNLHLAGGAAERRFEMKPGFSPTLEIYAAVSGEAGVDFVVTGSGGLVLRAANSFQGRLLIGEGTSVQLFHDHGLGSTASGTIVSNGATLSLIAPDVPSEPLSLRGVGIMGIGALRVANDFEASWAGPITLEADTVISVLGTNGRLTLSGPITGPGGLTNVGEGTLVFAGGLGNDYAGDTWVQEGTLRLAKAPGAKAILNGRLIVGDGLGGPLADRVVWYSDHQLDGFVSFPFAYYYGRIPVVINSSGFFDLNGFEDHVSAVTMHAGRIETRGVKLVLDGDVSADSTSTNMAIIKGRLGLRPLGFGPLNILRTFNVAGTNSLLDVRADLLGVGSGLRKTGIGHLSLSGANTYDWTTILSEGVLSISSGQALGGTWQGTVVEPGASLALSGFGVTVTNEALVLAGNGFKGRGALYTESWLITLSNAWTGPVTLSNDTRIAVAHDTILNLACPIAGPGGFTKTGAGRLVLSGTNVNTYAGTTRVEQGTLELQKGAAALNGAVPGRLEIGAATVRLLAPTQIDNDADVDIGATGLLDLNNWGEAFDALSGSGSVQLGSGYLNVGTDNGSSTFAGQITGSGDLTKFGTGTLRLTGNNPYTGVTTVREGTLIVDGAQSGSAVTVQSGATLRGTGWIGPLSVYGRVAPGGAGAVPGTLICGNLALGSSGRLACTLFDSGSDQLRVSGSVQLGSATLELARQTTPWLGQRFWLIDNDGTDPVAGTFAGLPEGATVVVDGVPLQLSYRGGSSNDVVLTFAQAPLEVAGVRVLWGNGNGVLDPGDCSLLEVLLTNRTGAMVRQIQASRLPGAPGSGGAAVDGLWLPRWQSAYPDLPAGGTGANSSPLQLWLGSWWPAKR